MWRLSLAGAVLAACYAPTAREGAPCGPGGACPSALVCSAATQTCERAANPTVDAHGIDAAAIDAALDAGPCTGMVMFEYTGTIVSHTVASCATMIRIEAWGAQGGNGVTTAYAGGKGAHAAGTFAITGGSTLRILVGGKGVAAADTSAQRGGTGGGGTFVVGADDAPLLVAGGGGGAVEGYAAANGGPGQITTAGQDGGGGVPGGTNGGGGATHPNLGFHAGTGAGGLTGDGLADSNGSNGTPNGRGRAFANGGAGGAAGSQGRAGGFGGGGAAGFTGGGGGGYSGGASSANELDADHSGGGGGSYNAGTMRVMQAGINDGDGRVIITW